MGRVSILESTLTAIADAIRTKLSSEDTYKPSEMADAIGEIGSATLDTKSITANGTYKAEDDDLDGYSQVTVNVSGGVNNQNKTVHPSSSDQSITADSGYTGLGTVTVKGVTIENLSASNIVSGVTVKIGDADDDDSIASVTGTASGGASFATGTFTPESDVTSYEIETDGNYDHFVMFTDTKSSGGGVRAFRIGEADFSGSTPVVFLVSTNNSGSTVALDVDYTNSGLSKSGTKVVYNKSTTKLLSGKVHRWVAW